VFLELLDVMYLLKIRQHHRRQQRVRLHRHHLQQQDSLLLQIVQ
jgi:hypothetical protein